MPRNARFRPISLLSVLFLSFVLVACSQGNSVESEGEGNSSSEASEIMVSGSASQGGANYLIMAGWAELMGENTNYTIRNESSGGPATNMQLLNEGQMDFGVLSGIVAREGIDGEGWAEGQTLDNVRAMFGLHNLFMDGLTLASNSDIETIRDLDGKTVSVGPAGGTPYVLVKRVFNMLGIEAKYVELGQGDSVDALKNGQLDAVVFAGTYPRPAYTEAEANTDVKVITISEEDIDKIISEYPAFQKGTIPADTYGYLEEDNVTLKDNYMYGTRADMSEEIVYEITKSTIEHLEEFQEVHKGLSSVDLESLGQTPIPLHPGAAKAMEEAGIEISEAAQPID